MVATFVQRKDSAHNLTGLKLSLAATATCAVIVLSTGDKHPYYMCVLTRQVSICHTTVRLATAARFSQHCLVVVMLSLTTTVK